MSVGVYEVIHIYICKWLHKTQDLKPQGILFYYAFITPLLRLYYARLVIAHFWLWVLILGPFSGSRKSHETPMPAKWPCHYPRDIRKTSAGVRKWVDEVSEVFGKWAGASKMHGFSSCGTGFLYYAFITPILRLYYANEDFKKKHCWRNKFIGGGGYEVIHIYIYIYH